MKVLLYNWIPPHSPRHLGGGGVQIYTANLLKHLADVPDVDVYFISSGLLYSALKTHPFIKPDMQVTATSPDRQRHFILWNSEVPSPGQIAFDNPVTLRAEATENTFIDYVRENGPFDIIHFHNLEGIPARVLQRLKETTPGTKLVLSLHNYFPFCPQVNLWHRDTQRCTDFQDGRQCVDCVPLLRNHRSVIRYRRVENVLRAMRIPPRVRDSIRSAGLSLYNALAHLRRGRSSAEPKVAGQPVKNRLTLPVIESSSASYFKERRPFFVDQINRYVDAVLCVSAYVAEVAARYGIHDALLQVDYIGTAHAAIAHRHPRKMDYSGDVLTIAYLGYMRTDKGFYFLLEALKAFPPDHARNISVVVAAKNTDSAALAQLRALDHKFRKILYFDGYTHQELDSILKEVTLGIVPVLWEDNLPQVAIELVSRGIPILTSDLGGAQEIGGGNRDFVFEAGNAADLTEKIAGILKREVMLTSFWRQTIDLVTMESHILRLLDRYSALSGLSPLHMSSVHSDARIVEQQSFA